MTKYGSKITVDTSNNPVVTVRGKVISGVKVKLIEIYRESKKMNQNKTSWLK